MAIEIHQLTINSSANGKSETNEDKEKRDEVAKTNQYADKKMINSLKKELTEECRQMIINCLEEQRSR